MLPPTGGIRKACLTKFQLILLRRLKSINISILPMLQYPVRIRGKSLFSCYFPGIEPVACSVVSIATYQYAWEVPCDEFRSVFLRAGSAGCRPDSRHHHRYDIQVSPGA